MYLTDSQVLSDPSQAIIRGMCIFEKYNTASYIYIYIYIYIDTHTHKNIVTFWRNEADFDLGIVDIDIILKPGYVLLFNVYIYIYIYIEASIKISIMLRKSLNVT